MSLSPAQRQLYGRAGALESWARTEDRTARTARARATFRARFELEADPDGTLPPAERARRAEQLRRAHYQRLAARSAEVRRARKGGATT